MTYEEAIKTIESNRPTSGFTMLCEALDMAIEALEKPQNSGWIPVTYHEPVEEDGEDMSYDCILDCPLPDEGEEILISVNGIVNIDVCCYSDEGWYLDNYGDWLKVDAWMPLPKPYKAGDKE